MNRSERVLNLRSQRHIYRQFRYGGRKIFVPIFLSFSILDFIYQPNLALNWFFLRLIFAFSMFASFYILKKGSIRKKYAKILTVFNLVLACSIINIMVYQSGGYNSKYMTGVILASVIGVEVFRLPKYHTLASLLLSYGPTLAIIGFSGGREHWRETIIQAFFLIGMLFIQMIFRKSEEAVFSEWAQREDLKKVELEKLRKTEILKRHFPQSIRDAIENGTEKLQSKKLISNAVVGFADITNSTELANKIPLVKDWELKEKFLNAATARATQSGLIVLTHLGDGFLFLANYNEQNDWSLNIVVFFENLLKDFDNIVKEVLSGYNLETGIKCAISMGPTLIGFIGTDQAYFTAMGPDVNLASRICSRAQNNELMVSSRVWDVLKHFMGNWESKPEVLKDMKGFENDIPVVRVHSRKMKDNSPTCSTCNSQLVIVRTEEGFFDIKCPNGHELNDNKKLIKAA